ncbi:WXG100 family type VII secretion target [Nocardia stercoris]|uniref:WXG100 family type VII secretion target n=1 Tax=Nocardia stercoris TaxID=2483361 RepID=A0A3M2LF11_9NOCA|nr:WXG100 family type VII secretion target [Nocardia stercoris]RMI35163.1 WXG100 family type VII secretion target [Nocardia stercoris]
MSEFSVDLDKLDNIVIQLKNLNSFFTEHLTELEQRIGQLHSGGKWDGVAAAAHQEAHDIWSKGAQELNDAIAAMSTAGREAHTAYTDAKTANGKIFPSG